MFSAMYSSSFITMDLKCSKIKMANKPLKTDAKKRRGLAGRYAKIIKVQFNNAR
jgi:hypothetical protein